LISLILTGGYPSIESLPQTEWLRFTALTQMHIRITYSNERMGEHVAQYAIDYAYLPRQVKDLTVLFTSDEDHLHDLPRDLEKLRFDRHSDFGLQVVIPGDLPRNLRQLMFISSYRKPLSQGVLPETLTHLTVSADCLWPDDENSAMALPLGVHTLCILPGQFVKMAIHPCLNLGNILKLTIHSLRGSNLQPYRPQADQHDRFSASGLRLPYGLTHFRFNGTSAYTTKIECQMIPPSLTHLDCQNASVEFGEKPLHQRLKSLRINMSSNLMSDLIRQARQLPQTDELYLTISSLNDFRFTTAEEWGELILALDRSITRLEIDTPHTHIHFPTDNVWPPNLQHLDVRKGRLLSSGHRFPQSLTSLRLSVPLPLSARPMMLQDFQQHEHGCVIAGLRDNDETCAY
jgi:hypothetical protein